MYNPKIELIESMDKLIALYGVDACQNALTFVSRFPESKSEKVIDPVTNVSYLITKAQFEEVRSQKLAGNRITAIKLYRDFTSTFLVEAKRIVEFEPNWR